MVHCMALIRSFKTDATPLAAEPIGLRPAHLLALVGRPYLWPPTSLGDVNFFFLYIAIMTGENLQ